MRRFNVPSTFKTGQHSGVTSLNPQKRQPQQSQQEQQPEQIGEEENKTKNRKRESKSHILLKENSFGTLIMSNQKI